MQGTTDETATGKRTSQDEIGILYTHYRHTMYCAALGILRDEGLAEDAVHETFIKLYRVSDLLHFESDVHARAFLIRSVQNMAKDMLKSKSRKHENLILEELDDVEAQDGVSALDRLIVGEAVEILRKALSDMSPKMADVLRYSIQYGCKDGDIARLLGIRPGNVRTLLHRGRKKLSAVLEKEGMK